MKRILLSWSSGKDSAWALHVLRQRSDLEIAGLMTTVNQLYQRIAIHAVRLELLQRQADVVDAAIARQARLAARRMSTDRAESLATLYNIFKLAAGYANMLNSAMSQ